MTITLEQYDPARHDQGILADLIFRSDEEINPLVYGDDAIQVITRLLSIEGSYFSPAYTRCAMSDGQIVGVIVGFPVREKSRVDQLSGRAYIKAMGFFSFVKKLPLYLKMGKIVAGEMDEDGFYIHTISVSPTHQSQGIGSRMIEIMAEKHGKLYLHVNRDNQRAVNFYERVGFQKKFEGTITHKGRELSEFLMEKK
jgi:ribosomal protein S18 acetylase RimI-like enzyme